MSKRCTLHPKKLEEFKAWCVENGYEVREGRGEFQVMQVRYKGHFLPVYWRLRGDHLTTCNTLIPLVRKYIETRNTGKCTHSAPEGVTK